MHDTGITGNMFLKGLSLKDYYLDLLELKSTFHHTIHLHLHKLNIKMQKKA